MATTRLFVCFFAFRILKIFPCVSVQRWAGSVQLLRRGDGAERRAGAVSDGRGTGRRGRLRPFSGGGHHRSQRTVPHSRPPSSGKKIFLLRKIIQLLHYEHLQWSLTVKSFFLTSKISMIGQCQLFSFQLEMFYFIFMQRFLKPLKN